MTSVIHTHDYDKMYNNINYNKGLDVYALEKPRKCTKNAFDIKYCAAICILKTCRFMKKGRKINAKVNINIRAMFITN